MAFPSNYLLLFCFTILLFFTSPSTGKSFRPKALVLPVSKDPSTNQYLTVIKQRTPLVPLNLTLDLGGQFLWVNCEDGYVSSSYKPAHCGSAPCKLTGSQSCAKECNPSPNPGCNNNTCNLLADNRVTLTISSGEVALDVVAIQSTDGSNPGPAVSVPKFLFTCGTTYLLEGLAKGAKGMVALGRTNISIPSQFSSAFGFPKKFAICLSSSTTSKGVVFFGDEPYVFLPDIDVTNSLIYTPLILNPVSTASAYFAGEQSADYFIGVRSIKINGHTIPVNKTLLKINEEGYGGTKISTVNPYTVLQTSVYQSVINRFIKELAHVPRVPALEPFGACFNSTFISSTRVGPGVPQIDLVLQKSSVVWRIFGANSMVQVKKDVLCLGFVDGGENPRTTIVIGGHQLENNLLQFDLANSKLGFSSSLLFRQTTCANFNFTSNY